MSNKYLRLSIVTLCVSIAGGISVLVAQGAQAPNPTVNQFNSQINSAQQSAVSNLQSNNYPYPAQSVNYPDTLTALNSIGGGIGTLVTYTYNTLTTLLFQPTYNVGVSMANGSVQPNILSTVDVSAAMAGIQPPDKNNPDSQPVTPATMYTAQSIYNTLTVTDKNAMARNYFYNVYAPITQTSNSCPGGIFSSLCSNQSPPVDNLNANSLLGPIAYDSNQVQSAHNYVVMASGAANPIAGLSFVAACGTNPDPACITNIIQKNNLLPKYLATLRTYAAQQSVGISALYELFAERTLAQNLDGSGNPHPAHLGQQAGLPTSSPNYPEASPLQVDNYMATRRLTDPNWYAAMETANAATLARENLYLQAENRVETYKLRMQVERLTAIMAVMQLQLLRFSQSQWGESINDQVNQINKQPPFNGQRMRQ